jgi:hypothetical protein
MFQMATRTDVHRRLIGGVLLIAIVAIAASLVAPAYANARFADVKLRISGSSTYDYRATVECLDGDGNRLTVIGTHTAKTTLATSSWARYFLRPRASKTQPESLSRIQTPKTTAQVVATSNYRTDQLPEGCPSFDPAAGPEPCPSVKNKMELSAGISESAHHRALGLMVDAQVLDEDQPKTCAGPYWFAPIPLGIPSGTSPLGTITYKYGVIPRGFSRGCSRKTVTVPGSAKQVIESKEFPIFRQEASLNFKVTLKRVGCLG